jgi:hypothetical protein
MDYLIIFLAILFVFLITLVAGPFAGGIVLLLVLIGAMAATRT